MFKIVENKHPRLCCAYRCPNRRGSRDRFCSKHRHRYNKIMRPVAYAYHNLKANARRRGKHFDLSMEDFREFCKQTGYIDLKGKVKSAASIDRIDASKGYTIDNIQVLTLEENGRKGAKEKPPF